METKMLTISILKSLKEKCLCLNEINQKLEMDKLSFEPKMLFMSISKLLINDYILSNWIPDQQGHLVKHYYLAKNGLKYIEYHN